VLGMLWLVNGDLTVHQCHSLETFSTLNIHPAKKSKSKARAPPAAATPFCRRGSGLQPSASAEIRYLHV